MVRAVNTIRRSTSRHSVCSGDFPTAEAKASGDDADDVDEEETGLISSVNVDKRRKYAPEADSFQEKMLLIKNDYAHATNVN